MKVRRLTRSVVEALRDTPVVLVNGPRQVGKSTLAQGLVSAGHLARYLTLDDAAVFAAAARDPQAFVEALTEPTVIDEVQRVPELLRAIKLQVDRRRAPGRFLLTGSADILLLPRVSESLSGRIQILTLQPFSVGEIDEVEEDFIDAVFASSLDTRRIAAVDRTELLRRAAIGGYPEVVARPAAPRRRRWFGDYITTLLQKDIRDMANIEGLAQMPRLLALLAGQATGLINMATMSRDLGVSQPTLKRYVTLLQAAFLHQPLPAWAGSPRRRLVRAPKAFLNDSGLLAHLLDIDEDSFGDGPAAPHGPLLESFVAQELRKQIPWSRVQPGLSYYRTAAGAEVDFVLEDRHRRLVGIEVKASSSIGPRELKGLEDLADAVGDRLLRGIVLHTGREAVSFSKKLHALPLSALWQLRRERDG